MGPIIVDINVASITGILKGKMPAPDPEESLAAILVEIAEGMMRPPQKN